MCLVSFSRNSNITLEDVLSTSIRPYYPAGEYGIALIRADGSSVIVRVAGGSIVRVDYPAGPSFDMLNAILARDTSEMLLPPPSR